MLGSHPHITQPLCDNQNAFVWWCQKPTPDTATSRSSNDVTGFHRIQAFSLYLLALLPVHWTYYHTGSNGLQQLQADIPTDPAKVRELSDHTDLDHVLMLNQ